uniref:MH2 domain-containing protein n=1 Tax=Mesocestoides corti TaxID=53468 RepID=A0A5K3EHE8_MESCO
MNCQSVNQLFDVGKVNENEAGLPYPREWKSDSEVLGTFSLLSSSIWKKQDRAHQAFYAPVACVELNSRVGTVSGLVKDGIPVYPYRGLTLVWSARWEKRVSSK